jgi:predicted ATPase
MDRSGICQVIMATHAPLLMAYPGARCCSSRNTDSIR